MARTATQVLRHTPTVYRFALANEQDDADIRRLLREGVMQGPIRITMEREPSYFAALAHSSAPGADHQTLICRDAAGRLLGMGTRSTQSMLMNGVPVRVAYLSGLRFAPGAAGRKSMIVSGYRAMADLDDADLTLTTIMSDNAPARRLLERGLPGLPRYEPVTEYHSVLLKRISTRTQHNIVPASEADVPELADFMLRQSHSFALSPAPLADHLRAALAQSNLTIYLAREKSRIVACLGRLDTRAHKQIRVASYAPLLSVARPAINTIGRLLGWPTLPRPGSHVQTQYVSHLAASDSDARWLTPLLAAASSDASRAGCAFLAGFDVRHPLRRHFEKHSLLTMRSTVYRVHWNPSDTTSLRVPPGLPLNLEVSEL